MAAPLNIKDFIADINARWDIVGNYPHIPAMGGRGSGCNILYAQNSTLWAIYTLEGHSPFELKQQAPKGGYLDIAQRYNSLISAGLQHNVGQYTEPKYSTPPLENMDTPHIAAIFKELNAYVNLGNTLPSKCTY